MCVKGIIPIPDGSLARGSHAICVVGYDDNSSWFKFKNSWGEEWGDKGYGSDAWVSVDQITNVLRGEA
jgi:C1A family cysteine protease